MLRARSIGAQLPEDNGDNADDDDDVDDHDHDDLNLHAGALKLVVCTCQEPESNWSWVLTVGCEAMLCELVHSGGPTQEQEGRRIREIRRIRINRRMIMTTRMRRITTRMESHAAHIRAVMAKPHHCFSNLLLLEAGMSSE